MSDSGKGYSEGSELWAYLPLLKDLIGKNNSLKLCLSLFLLLSRLFSSNSNWFRIDCFNN